MINPDKTALLVIDVQNDFCSPEGMMAENGENLSCIDETIPQLAWCIEQCRSKGMTVIFVKTDHSTLTDSETWQKRGEAAKGVCRSEWGKQFYKIYPEESDVVVMKNRYSAFVGTNLEVILRANKIENILFAGFATNVCVESTVREAFMKDYYTVTLSDCTASYRKEEHESSLRNLKNYFGVTESSEEIMNKTEKSTCSS